jgi:putative ABC transport system substrate-binding protein
MASLHGRAARLHRRGESAALSQTFRERGAQVGYDGRNFVLGRSKFCDGVVAYCRPEGNIVKRREFIALVGGAAAARPFAARAQQAGKVPTVGFLSTTTPAAMGPWIAALEQRLSELGWIKGRTVAIEYRWAEGHADRYGEFAAEFVRLKVDVIVTTVPAVAALKQATSVIPIVFALATDPVGGGLVTSLARPGGNVTGLSMQATDLAGKRVELLRDIVPGLKRLAVLGNVGIPQVVLEMHEVEAASPKLDLHLVPLEIRRADDIAPAFAALKDRADAMYVCTDPLSVLNRVQINSLALGARLATVHGIREFAEAGGLLSYEASFTDQFRHVADLVDKILRGTKAGDIPVEQPTKFELIINRATAKALGLSIPQTLLATADEVID